MSFYSGVAPDWFFPPRSLSTSQVHISNCSPDISSWLFPRCAGSDLLRAGVVTCPDPRPPRSLLSALSFSDHRTTTHPAAWAADWGVALHSPGSLTLSLIHQEVLLIQSASISGLLSSLLVQGRLPGPQLWHLLPAWPPKPPAGRVPTLVVPHPAVRLLS